MIDFNQCMDRLRILMWERNKDRKIKDKDIAAILKLNPQYYAVIKRRKKIPYEALAYYCKEHNINLNWLLLGQEPSCLTSA